MQKFAEKPKGKELDAMKVDTTVLGKPETSQASRLAVALQSVSVNGTPAHAAPY